ncbi:MAG: hypothetical protein SFT94_07205 [Pseudanabaenaceae cyanobacterium bins.68]|nr:hypothetical protein [Pseudanabaenaceae cyanobacterium bins.68]
MKAIKKALKRLGEKIGRAMENLIDSLLGGLGGRQPEPELIPIPVRDTRQR